MQFAWPFSSYFFWEGESSNRNSSRILRVGLSQIDQFINDLEFIIEGDMSTIKCVA